MVLGWALAQAGPSTGQEPPAGDAAAPPAPAQPQESTEALSTRYRFLEKYALAPDPAKPELITQYQVGALQTLKTETEKAQGAPDRKEITTRTIYTERPAKVTRLGEVTDTVRHYDSFRIQITPKDLSPNASLFKDLSIWYRLRPGRLPELLSLTEARPLRDVEYHAIVGDQLFLPQLAAILPRTPVRVGDTWSIPRQAGQALLGRITDEGDYALEGTLREVRKAERGTGRTAVLEFSGHLTVEPRAGEVRAEVLFVFDLPAAVTTPPVPGSTPEPKTVERASDKAADRKTGTVEARGRITQVRLGGVMSTPIDENRRLKQIVTRELNLQRRPAPTPGAADAASPAGLTIPEPPPTATEANSWLLHDDPQRRFHFRHPQELTVQRENPDELDLIYPRPDGGSDVLRIILVPELKDPQRDRMARDPEALRQALRAEWERKRYDLVPGPAGWLPERE
ncbi:MAG TPA: hypothetical protein VFF52_02455, partial [Isosphaeraceae bacterium]|nr:hypothetical protein [Isosphaeraceae bacterium]